MKTLGRKVVIEAETPPRPEPDQEEQPVVEAAPGGFGAPIPLVPQAPAGQDEVAAEVMRFTTENLPRWLPIPNFSLEIVRRVEPVNSATSDENVLRVLEVFPQYPVDVIRNDLARSRSPQRTIDNILNGRLPLDPVNQQNTQEDREEIQGWSPFGFIHTLFRRNPPHED